MDVNNNRRLVLYWAGVQDPPVAEGESFFIIIIPFMKKSNDCSVLTILDAGVFHFLL